MSGRKADDGDELKLTIDLIPRTSWYRNLRAVLGKRQWDDIRRKTYASSGYRCSICGAEGRMNCHEVWVYEKEVQSLSGFIALCDSCHHVKHFGFSQVQAAKGLLDLEDIVCHFMRVNRCTRQRFEQHVQNAFTLWEQRSQRKWKVDVGKYAGEYALGAIAEEGAP